MRYYVESDGRIYLVPRDGGLDLPHPNELPFDVERIAPLAGDDDAWFCVPDLPEHPRDWPLKDNVPADADARVGRAVHASMPRVVVEGVCSRGGRILLVKGARGLTEGLWTLPGGFLRFGETPDEGVRRELAEEIGVETRVGNLLAVRSRLGRRSRLHWIMLFYRVEATGELKPNPDEIAEAGFFDVDAATAMIGDEMMAGIVRELA